MYSDLNDFLADLDKRGAAGARARAGQPRSRDRRGHRSRVQDRRAAARRCCSSSPTGFDMPVATQRLRLDRAHVPRARREVARRSGAGDRRADDAADARRASGRAEDAADGRPAARPDAEDGEGRAVPGGRRARRHARRAADPEVLARGRRPLHHVAAGVHEGSRDRHAQHRHLPHAGVRRPHDRHALAAAQGRRAAPPRRRAAGQAARGGRRARARSRCCRTARRRRCPKGSTSCCSAAFCRGAGSSW